jgi:hypothetical protein
MAPSTRGTEGELTAMVRAERHADAAKFQ